VEWSGLDWVGLERVGLDWTRSTGNASLGGSDWRSEESEASSDACQLYSVLPPGPWPHVMELVRDRNEITHHRALRWWALRCPQPTRWARRTHSQSQTKRRAQPRTSVPFGVRIGKRSRKTRRCSLCPVWVVCPQCAAVVCVPAVLACSTGTRPRSRSASAPRLLRIMLSP